MSTSYQPEMLNRAMQRGSEVPPSPSYGVAGRGRRSESPKSEVRGQGLTLALLARRSRSACCLHILNGQVVDTIYRSQRKTFCDEVRINVFTYWSLGNGLGHFKNFECATPGKGEASAAMAVVVNDGATVAQAIDFDPHT